MILHWQCFDPVSPSGLCLFPEGDRKQLFEQQMQPSTCSSSHYWEGQSWELLPFLMRREWEQRHNTFTHVALERAELALLMHLSKKRALCIPQPSAAMSISRRKRLRAMPWEFNSLLYWHNPRMGQSLSLKCDPTTY